MICTWNIYYDNLPHTLQNTKNPGSRERHHWQTTFHCTQNTLHWLKSVISLLININIWQELINRSFAILIYQTKGVGPPSIFRSIIQLSIKSAQHLAIGCTFLDFLHLLWPGHSEFFLWLMIVILHVKVWGGESRQCKHFYCVTGRRNRNRDWSTGTCMYQDHTWQITQQKHTHKLLKPTLQTVIVIP